VGKFANENFVGGRFYAPQLMIDVKDLDGQTEFPQSVQQENGIRAARNSNTDSGAAGKHALVFDGGCDALNHVLIVQQNGKPGRTAVGTPWNSSWI
jgi:hypothetical protein